MLKSSRPIQFQISGRLGNQLFQFAFAHELSKKFNRKVEFVTDKFHYPNGSTCDLVSSNFQCKHIIGFRQKNAYGHVIRVLDKIHSLRMNFLAKLITKLLRIHRQLDSHIPSSEITVTPRLVTGFFIDQAIVEKNEAQLYDEITSHLDEVAKGFSMLEDLKRLGSYQMMHVRRGDYINNTAEFGILSSDFYKSQKTNLPLVLALENISDLDNLKEILNPALVLSKENSSAWETLFVMSKATDLVMSNSTFSWWGGFLSTNNGGIARMPTPYFKRNVSVDRFFKYKLFSEVESDFANEE